jgi:hypothetical protein
MAFVLLFRCEPPGVECATSNRRYAAMASVGRESQEMQGMPAVKGAESLDYRRKRPLRREMVMQSGGCRARAGGRKE